MLSQSLFNAPWGGSKMWLLTTRVYTVQLPLLPFSRVKVGRTPLEKAV